MASTFERLAAVESGVAGLSFWFFWITMFLYVALTGWCISYFWLLQPSEIGVELKVGLFILGISWLVAYVALQSLGVMKLRGAASVISGWEIFNAFTLVFAILLPCLWFVFRAVIAEFFELSPLDLDRLTAKIGVALLVLGCINVYGHIWSQTPVPWIVQFITSMAPIVQWIRPDKLTESLKYHYRIFVEVWRPMEMRSHVRIQSDAVSSIRASRSSIYMDRTLLPIFQETCLSRFHEPQQLVASKTIQDWISKRATTGPSPIRILDIGGGEGVATRNFLLHLCRELSPCVTQPSFEIDLFENQDLAREYVDTVATCSLFSVTVHLHGPFEPSSELSLEYTGAFDFVLALHSLYSSFDSAQKSILFRGQLEKLKGDLLSYIKPQGVLAVSLTSKSGESSEFKRICLLEAFGRTIQDAVGDDIRMLWGSEDESIYVDTFFYFTTDEDGNMNREALLLWLRYFARLTEHWCKRIHVDYLLENLTQNCRAFASLPEAAKKEIIDQKVATEEVLSRSRFLPHKTMLLLYVRRGSNHTPEVNR